MFLHKLLGRVEKLAGRFQGKGWGAATIEHEVAAILQQLPNPKVVLDVGGNVGDWTQRFIEKAPAAQIYIFEPAAVNVRCLKARFHGHANVRIIDRALSDRDGEQSLYANQEGSGIASLHRRDLQHYGMACEAVETVMLMSFNTFREQHQIDQIDVLKLDIEGHELQVLKSIPVASLASIKIIQFEFGGCNIDSRVFFRDFWQLLQTDFKLFRMSPLGLVAIEKYTEREERFEISNFLCVNRRFRNQTVVSRAGFLRNAAMPRAA